MIRRFAVRFYGTTSFKVIATQFVAFVVGGAKGRMPFSALLNESSSSESFG